jgi:hypothetical protein
MPAIAAAISVYLPIQTVSEMNMREHWAARNRRKKSQQLVTAAKLGPFVKALNGLDLVSVRLTRFGKRKMDDDNLASSFKHVQDAVAKCLGIDDGKIKWKYEQVHHHEYKVRVHVKAA